MKQLITPSEQTMQRQEKTRLRERVRKRERERERERDETVNHTIRTNDAKARKDKTERGR